MRPFVATVGIVYNAADDFVCDGLDSCEEALKEAGESGRNPTSSAKSAAVSRGCDNLVERLRAAFDNNLDKFEAYASRNLFDIPDMLVLDDDEVESPSGEALSEPEEGVPQSLAECEETVTELRQRLAAARRRLRTANYLKKFLSKRVPQAEEAAEAIRMAKEDFARANDHGASEVAEVRAKTLRLEGLCDRLSEAGASEASSRRTTAGRRSSAGADFGSVRTAYERDTAAVGRADLAAVRAAAQSLGTRKTRSDKNK